jgi:hypothetical protein
LLCFNRRREARVTISEKNEKEIIWLGLSIYLQGEYTLTLEILTLRQDFVILNSERGCL